MTEVSNSASELSQRASELSEVLERFEAEDAGEDTAFEDVPDPDSDDE
jgi:hypothetical protein